MSETNETNETNRNMAEVLSAAQARERRAEIERKPIDYARMRVLFPKQKAALTRAEHMPMTTPEESKRRLYAIVATCRKTVREWDEVGAWPDAWSRWQRSLDDACLKCGQSPVRLESLR
jgi:hypothetical protein